MHKTLIILLIVGVAVARAGVCYDDYCDDVKCEPVSCTENEQYTVGGSACGCCDTCFTIVKKVDHAKHSSSGVLNPTDTFCDEENGGSCYDYFDWGAEPPQMVCDEGLSCDYDTRVEIADDRHHSERFS
ncbi:hypothetical protein CEXT_635621 [Caerostris extrusa]|uniref:Uncharacterized protein n=1 Tax=Caerostris extrusa TaxID=172846 RepID=A0AAV4W165_CAEEX|nr:hypothetical protein CEXT_635621 [Caerostris extrusa]